MSTKNDRSDDFITVRLIAARNKKNIKQGDAAVSLGISVASLNRYEKGHRNAPADVLTRMAKLYDVSSNWLLTGEGEMMTEKPSKDYIHPRIQTKIDSSHKPGASFTSIKIKKIPVISWVQAGDFQDVEDPFQPGFADEFVYIPDSCGPNTFALRVEGNSMEPVFHPGEIIYVDPSRESFSGDFVIAKNGDQATFKKLVIDGEQIFLEPLNDRYPVRNMTGIAFKIIGRVIGKYMKF